MSDELAVISCAYPSEELALGAARDLVARRLAACAQAHPIRSVYAWQGQICEGGEWRLIVKTRRALAGEAMRAIRAGHPYTTPEILSTPVLAVDPDYAAWAIEVTREA